MGGGFAGLERGEGFFFAGDRFGVEDCVDEFLRSFELNGCLGGILREGAARTCGIDTLRGR